MRFADVAGAWARSLAFLELPRPWLEASALLAAGTAVAILFYAISTKFLLPLTRRTATTLDQLFIEKGLAPATWTILLFTLAAAARTLWPDPALDDAFRRAIVTALLIIWGAAVASIVAHLILRAGRYRGGDTGPRGVVILASRLTKVAVGIVIVLTVFTVWEVNVTPLVASAGLLGIALAFAAQDTLANLFAGIAIYLDRPYSVGDWVVLDAGSASQVRGNVHDVGLRSTRILTRDDVLITVPNSVIANGRVINESGGRPQYRIRIRVSVAYSSNLERAEEVLLEVARGHPRVLEEPPPRVRFRKFEDSGVAADFLVHIQDPSGRPLVIHELVKAVHKAFAENGIVIPFPQRDVHVLPRGDARPHERAE